MRNFPEIFYIEPYYNNLVNMVHDMRPKTGTWNKNKMVEVVPIHLYEKELEYAITLNPPFEGLINQRTFMIWCREMYTNIVQLENCHLKLYPELSDTMRPHLHGTITIGKDLNKFIFQDYPYILKYGQVNIKMFDGENDIEIQNSYDKWIIYCTKGKHLTQPFCRYGYPIDNKQKFDTGDERPKYELGIESNRQQFTQGLDEDENENNARDYGV